MWIRFYIEKLLILQNMIIDILSKNAPETAFCYYSLPQGNGSCFYIENKILRMFPVLNDCVSLLRILNVFYCENGPESAFSYTDQYLADVAANVKCSNSLSFSHIFSCGVPQGCPRPYTFYHVYTTPLSTLISSQSLNHHLYADDALLLFLPTRSLLYSISHLQDALQQISSWMTANLLTLNYSQKLNFFSSDSNNNQPVANCPLSTTHSARNLSFISTFTFVNVSAHYSTSKQPAPLPPLSFTPNSITATQ